MAERPDGSGEIEHPYRRADGHMVKRREVNINGLYRHLPAVHSESAAPPEAESALGHLDRFYLIDCGSRAVGFFKRLFSDIAHAGEEHDKARRVGTDIL